MSSNTNSTHIEEALAHQEQQISDLNDIVTKQANEIDILKQQLARLNSKLNMVQETSQNGEGESLSVTEQAAQNKPPHY